MTDQEINEAMARKLGDKAKFTIYETWETGKGLTSRSEPQPLDYCHSIEVAWEIVQQLYEEGMCIQINMAANEKKIGCGIGSPVKIFVFASADTAPMAICLAFLKLPSLTNERI